jgi:hypothetical protein
MLLGVAGVGVEGQVGRMAVVKLVVPGDEKNRERAMGHVGDGAFSIMKMATCTPPW